MNAPEASPRFLPVAITGTGVCAATGDLGAALWAGVATRMVCARPVAGLSVAAGDEEMAQPYAAPIAELPPELSAEMRIPIMAGQALSQACALLPEDRAGLRILVLTLLPAPTPECPAAGSLDQSELAGQLRDAHPALATAEMRFSAADAGATSLLATCLEELHRDQWDAVVFGGVDSLTDRSTVLALAAGDNCRTDLDPEATLPGEGAAYLLLQKPDPATAPLAIITALGHGQEDNPGKAADRPMTALAGAIEQALEGQCTPSQVETIVLPMGNDVPAALEWHQVQRKLWAEPEKGHGEMEELTPQYTIGDTGAAALPLCLAIGCARFEFDFPCAETMLVCEVGRQAPRGAVLLKRKPSDEKIGSK